jgi:hypothetical protein
MPKTKINGSTQVQEKTINTANLNDQVLETTRKDPDKPLVIENRTSDPSSPEVGRI